MQNEHSYTLLLWEKNGSDTSQILLGLLRGDCIIIWENYSMYYILYNTVLYIICCIAIIYSIIISI